ncbi:hypothetical protein NEOLEDRAFT_1148845 [Neolentinus lepideus HHB14362 ss-1]|uniref:Uncharacterized protein n=1 Tax=Neolentinus lepideus HHB14362 ss-1 TaxID=1314782 RepID=A0A165RT81_9AGAM|nr:hypothetical protein NEOLEDRAFT_1148845 [Neolentinus lepideus HHB14362 ss-1]
MSQIYGSPEVASVLSTRERAQSPLVFNNRPIDIASIGTRNEVDSEFEARCSSARMYHSSSQLHDTVDRIFYIFYTNASKLFPHSRMQGLGDCKHDDRDLSGARDASHFVSQIDRLATDVRSFLGCLNEFPPYNDVIVNSSISAFENDLKYWASWLKYYQAKSESFPSLSVQQYLHDRSVQFGDHLEHITSALERFMHLGITTFFISVWLSVDYVPGVPTIQFTQNHAANNLQNLATIATFLSAVTATTLQFSYPENSSHIAVAVNGFWFSSLVLSIGAAVNSVLGLTWKQAVYRSPRSQAPRWVLWWVNNSPIAFLVLSVLAFSTGLALFTFSTGQNIVVRIVTVALTGFSILGLASLSTWFALERWIFVQYKGEKSLWEIWVELRDWAIKFSGLDWLIDAVNLASKRVKSFFWRVAGNLWTISSRVENEIRMKRQDTIDDELDLIPGDSPNNSQRLPYSMQDVTPQNGSQTNMPSLIVVPPDARAREKQDDDPSSSSSPQARRIANAVLATVKLRKKRRAQVSRLSLPRTSISRQLDGHGRRDWTIIDRLQPMQQIMTRANNGVAKALKRLQFSPDGKLLAAWEETGKAGIYRTTDQFTRCCTLQHSEALPVATRCPQLPTPSYASPGTLLCIEGKDIVRRDYNGTIRNTFGRLTDKATPLDIAASPSDRYVVILGSLRASPDGLEPKNFDSERQLIVFDIYEEKIHSRMPVLTGANKVQLSRDSKYVLVDCDTDRKITQVWRRETKDGTHPGGIELKHALVSKGQRPVGHSFFAGEGDQWVVRMTEDGGINIWDRESGQRIRHISGPNTEAGKMSCAAWNPHADGVLVTGTTSGEIVVWTATMKLLVEERVEDEATTATTSRVTATAYKPNPRQRSDTL